MSQAATAWPLAALAILGVASAWGQSSAQSSAPQNPGWHRLGQPSINLHLAGPATGPVARVWYSADGGTLFARALSGQTFQTADLENWTPVSATAPDENPAASAERTPEREARVATAAGDSRHVWSLGHDLSVSDDGGHTWTNISGSAGESVIGEGQRAVAINPSDSQAIAVANDDGVWQTHDGGQSWAGLNDSLPNLPVRSIVSVRRGSIQIALTDGRVLQLSGTRSPWVVSSTASPAASEAAEAQQFSRALGAEITAIARSGDYLYAGSSDGIVWVSHDRGTTWSSVAQAVGRGPVERFYVDPDAPRAAIAVIAGSGAHIARTVNAGAVWDDISGTLADVTVHAAAADRATGTAYVATDKGIFTARVDLNTFAPSSAWTAISGSLPNADVVDVTLDAASGQIFAAVEGYGLYAAPVRAGGLRLANAADFSDRAAAPGSVITVTGAHVVSAGDGSFQYPLLASGDSEAQLQVPFETSPASVGLGIQTSTNTATLPLTIRAVSPAIFIDREGTPFFVDGESGLALDPSAPTHPGTRIEMMATGLGRVQPDWPTGVPAPADNPPAVIAPVRAFLGSTPVTVTKATLAPGYVGYYLVEIELPSVLDAGAAELYLRAGGDDSNHVRLLVSDQ
jgi:uncharacterized protein (TIGR03437 family)